MARRTSTTRATPTGSAADLRGLLVLPLALVVGGCTPAFPAASATQDAVPSFTPYVAPPSTIPTVTMWGQQLAPVAHHWRLGGRYDVVHPVMDEEPTSTPVSPRGGDPVFVLETDRLPTVVQVGAPGQIPSDCHTGTGCAIEATGGQVRVRVLPPNAFSDVLALYVAYPTFEPLDVREHIAEYGASWVVSRKEGS